MFCGIRTVPTQHAEAPKFVYHGIFKFQFYKGYLMLSTFVKLKDEPQAAGFLIQHSTTSPKKLACRARSYMC